MSNMDFFDDLLVNIGNTCHAMALRGEHYLEFNFIINSKMYWFKQLDEKIKRELIYFLERNNVQLDEKIKGELTSFFENNKKQVFEYLSSFNEIRDKIKEQIAEEKRVSFDFLCDKIEEQLKGESKGQVIRFFKEFVNKFSALDAFRGVQKMAFTGNAGIGKTAFFNGLKNNYEELKKDIICLDDSFKEIFTNENKIEMIKFKPQEGGLLICDFKEIKNLSQNELCEHIANIFLNQGIYFKGNIEYNNFYEKYKESSIKITNISDVFLEYASIIQKCKSARLVYVFDNVDLCPTRLQEAIEQVFRSIYNDIQNRYDSFQSKLKVNLNNIILITTLRQDTLHYFNRVIYYGDNGILSFPIPNVYYICREKFRLAIDEVLTDNRYGKTLSDIGILKLINPYTLEDVEINGINDLVKYVNDILFPEEFKYWKEFLNCDFNRFNNLIVNYDVRRLFLFHANLAKKGRKTLDLFDKKWDNYFNKFKYLEAIMLGTRGDIDNYIDDYGIFNYNKYIGYESYNSEVLLFNVFETYDFAHDLHIDYEDVFMIYIRIIQLLNRNPSESCSISVILNNMKDIFEEKAVERALKIMIFSGLLVETKIGSRFNVADSSIENAYESVILKNEDGIYGEIKTGNETAAHLYFFDLIKEFEYIYFMSYYYVNYPNSALRDKKLNAQKVDYIKNVETNYFDMSISFNKTHKEKSVTLFLIAMYYIIKHNIAKQIKKGVRDKFVNSFYPEPNDESEETHKRYFPWDRMMESVINTFKKKIEHAEREKKKVNNAKRIEYFNNRIDSLKVLLDILNKVFKEADDYFIKFKNKSQLKMEVILLKDEINNAIESDNEIKEYIIETLENMANKYEENNYEDVEYFKEKFNDLINSNKELMKNVLFILSDYPTILKIINMDYGKIGISIG